MASEHELVTAELRPKDLAKPTKEEAKNILWHWEAKIYDEAPDRTLDTVQDTQVARTFTDNFILAYWTSVFLIFWALVQSWPWPVIVLLEVLLVLGLGYLWNDSRTLGVIYYRKVLNAMAAISTRPDKRPATDRSETRSSNHPGKGFEF